MTTWVRDGSRPSPRPGGIALIEALVAMAIMAFGMLAVLGVQTTLRLNSDIAKQRSEATRIAEAEIERLRSFNDKVGVAGDGKLQWDEVVQTLNVDVTPENKNVEKYVINRLVTDIAGSSQKSIVVQVTWKDRLGADQSVTLGDSLAGASPVLSALAAAPAVRSITAQHKGRHPTIPSRAHDLGDGTSVFKPTESGTVAWTFNNTAGFITSVCTVSASATSADLLATDLVTCTPVDKGQLLSGHVRFNLRGATTSAGLYSTLVPVAGGSVIWNIDHAQSRVTSECHTAVCGPVVAFNPVVSPFDPVNDPAYTLVAIDSESPNWPSLPLSMTVGITSPNRPTPSESCFTNAPVGSLEAIKLTSVEYFCLIYPDAPLAPVLAKHTWNGRPSVIPGAFVGNGDANVWTVGTSAGQYRVCRYSKSSSDLAANLDHPLDYLNVTGNLTNQNFLVIDGRKTCPTDVAPDPAHGDYINTNTRPHQPAS